MSHAASGALRTEHAIIGGRRVPPSTPWWYPHDAAFSRFMGDSVDALYARQLGRKLRATLGLLGNPKLRRYGHVGRMLVNARKLF